MKLLVVAVLSAMGMSTASAAVNGTLTITGNVTAQTCEIDAAQLTRTVDLGEITKGASMNVAVDAPIQGVGKPLTFNVTKCPASTTSVGVKFDFTADTAKPQFMKNTGTGAGVLLGITDSSDDLVASGGTVNATDLDAKAGTATVNAKVQAYRIAVNDAGITAGDIASTATVTVAMK
ncbi:type 1 fimbrial protein [Salmonella enterica]